MPEFASYEKVDLFPVDIDKLQNEQTCMPQLLYELNALLSANMHAINLLPSLIH